MSRSRIFIVVGALFGAVAAGPAPAADMPGDYYLRGSLPSEPMQWDGFYIGGQFGYSILDSDYSDAVASVPMASGVDTTGYSYGGFVGYNTQVFDPQLVLGIELGYNRPSSLETSTIMNTATDVWTASYKLEDYWTIRGRAGYAIGQFLPYAVLGAAVGRVNYSKTSTSGVVSAQSNTFPVGFVFGLGMDVAVLPNVFLRAEWEDVIFQPEGGIRSSVQTGRVGIGLRF
jgi:outer membrane immunogenic protein